MKEPYLTITPLGGLGEIGLNCQLWETAGGVVMVDCGLMFPDDAHLGVDVVIHSATKFLSGHGDVLGGLVCGSESLMAKVRHYREINGATLDPFSAYMIIRGMKTLVLRLRTLWSGG